MDYLVLGAFLSNTAEYSFNLMVVFKVQVIIIIKFSVAQVSATLVSTAQVPPP